ncbi:pyridoxamine 5'-phosphate oxidase family protein [uncultured Tessaracoccus sp.]|uniref:pyridoxamine 5'-phosphate oxidase family protein n=1 Tax=uncultured Tessaracoccus sp. TaxID=905023 RepID=UPI0025EE74D5|nr:pyridoxamine 5'-phosphate oxidase family protein [uncultured Tessaracoccus sp.]
MDNDPVTYFTELAEAECRSLLRDVEYGRIAWHDEHGVTVLPVNFQLVDGHVVFHTAPETVLAGLADEAEVAFQVDDVDAEVASGWTVLVRGRTRRVTQATEPVTWLADDRTVGIMIIETELSGRALSGARRATNE